MTNEEYLQKSAAIIDQLNRGRKVNGTFIKKLCKDTEESVYLLERMKSENKITFDYYFGIDYGSIKRI